jgi:cytochrome oxidase assembly protein ShyY1
MVVLAAAMVGLGRWQLTRYHERDTINQRIDAAAHASPVALSTVARVGQVPPASADWTRVTVTGHFDPEHQVLARDRSIDRGVGFEVLTPLVRPDGSAVVVDRGWTASAASVPAPPDGEVTVTGRLRLPESRPDRPLTIDGQVEVRRIDPADLPLPYPVVGGYVLGDEPSQAGLTPIPTDHENSAMNAGYVVQWCAFALLTLAGFGWAARNHARGPDKFDLDAALSEAPVSPAV